MAVTDAPPTARDLDEARDRLQDEHDDRVIQLSFNVGGRQPDLASLKVSGSMTLERELRKGEQVRVTVATVRGGEVLCEGTGPVTAIQFKDEYKDGFIVGTERSHTVKLV